MGASSLGSRAIIGEFYNTLETSMQADYSGKIGMYFSSNQESEEYKWLGNAPAMREFVGGRQAKGLRENGLTVKNKTFEASLEISVDDLRRDKTGQILLRTQELADRANQHWRKLLSTLINDGATNDCYDGKKYFATNHVEGENQTSQSNLLTFDISDDSVVSSDFRGVAANPSAPTLQAAIMKSVQAILGFKDDQGEPMNEGAAEFLVMVPTAYYAAAVAAVALPTLSQGAANIIPAMKNYQINITPMMNPRLTWTDSFATFRTDGRVKPFILQEEVPPEIQAIAEGSEMEIKDRKHLYTATAIRNVGNGYWQHAVKTTLQA